MVSMVGVVVSLYRYGYQPRPGVVRSACHSKRPMPMRIKRMPMILGILTLSSVVRVGCVHCSGIQSLRENHPESRVHRIRN